jgi:hypothetical protein
MRIGFVMATVVSRRESRAKAETGKPQEPAHQTAAAGIVHIPLTITASFWAEVILLTQQPFPNGVGSSQRVS